jgi:hypothetical protein
MKLRNRMGAEVEVRLSTDVKGATAGSPLLVFSKPLRSSRGRPNILTPDEALSYQVIDATKWEMETAARLGYRFSRGSSRGGRQGPGGLRGYGGDREG